MATRIATYAWYAAGRFPLLGVGLVALVWQVQLIKEYYGGGSAISWIAPLISVTVALCPHWAGNAFRERRALAGLGFVLLFVFLFIVSVMGSLGRVGEFQSAKGSTAATSARTLKAAQLAVARAEANERGASENVNRFCGATTTAKVTTTEGSRKKAKAVSTQTVEADPRCATWTTELARRAEETTAARQSPDLKITVVDASADAKRIAAMLPFLSAETVEEWQPALMPLGLELIMALVFPFAFRPLEYDLQTSEQHDSPTPSNVVPFPSTNGLIMDNNVVAGLVAVWLENEGLPANVSLTEACAKFNAWMKAQQLVSVKSFSKALDTIGVQKRSKGGRTLIAAPDHKPRRRKKSKKAS